MIQIHTCGITGSIPAVESRDCVKATETVQVEDGTTGAEKECCVHVHMKQLFLNKTCIPDHKKSLEYDQ